MSKPSRIVVTGVNGFVGQHLARELFDAGHYVIGVSRKSTPDSGIANIINEYISHDLSEGWPGIKNVSAIIHLAGLSAVGPSFDNPQKYITANSSMVTHMCEYYLQREDRPRIITVSSGAVYEYPQAMPLTEESRTGFSSPYALSKALVENQCSYYRSRGLDCIVARPFNHIGPGQSAGFLVPDVVSQLRQSDTVKVGNISTKRDYTDVRDVVAAYRLLATANNLNHNTYNVCSGVSVSGEDIISLIKTIMKKPDAKVEIDKTKLRPTDANDIYGSYALLTADTGWTPEVKLSQTIKDCAL